MIIGVEAAVGDLRGSGSLRHSIGLDLTSIFSDVLRKIHHNLPFRLVGSDGLGEWRVGCPEDGLANGEEARPLSGMGKRGAQVEREMGQLEGHFP